jgi:phosphoesterase RecJ-like protein
MRQSLEMQERANAAEEDGDGFVNYPLTCNKVEAVAFLKESAPGVYRASLRSKGDINVARIAEKFGGGGHRNAAGCTLTGSWEEAEDAVVALLKEAVERRNGERHTEDETTEEVILPAGTEKRRPEARHT